MKIRTEQEVKSRLKELEEDTLTKGPFTEFEMIARKASKQTLEWILEESDKLLTF